MDNLEIKWSQNGDFVYLHINEYKFYIKLPFTTICKNFDITKVRQELKDYCLHYLLYGLGFNIKGKNTVKEYPQFYLDNKTSSRKHHNKIGLAYSNGIDSGASLLLLPKDETIPIFIHYNTSLSDITLNDYISSRAEHNNNAKIGIKKINSMNNLPHVYQFESDFELIQIVLTNKKKPKGWNCPFGHISILILFSDIFKLGYLSLGTVLESKFLNNGHNFKNIISTTRSESDTITASKILNTINLDLFYPVGGLSEVLTYKIVKNSVLSDICSSCVIGEKIECLDCIKCFRKKGFSGKTINFKSSTLVSIKNDLNKYPVKMATSTIYTCQKNGYSESEIINSLKHVDVSFVEKYYKNYLYPDSDEIDLVPKIYKQVIKDNLTKYNIEKMNDDEIKRLRNISEYFDNPEIKKNLINNIHFIVLLFTYLKYKK